MTTNNHPAHGPLSLDRLHQIHEILSKASAQSDGGNLGYAMADAVKVIDDAIASFGAEPVAWAKIGFEGYPLNLTQKHELAYSWRKNGYAAMPLYAAPTALVSVPDEIDKWQAIDDMRDHDESFRWDSATAYFEGWNACRAAMLQDAEPVRQTNKLPDDTRRLDWLDAQNKRLNQYYGSTYGWKFDANFQRNAMMLNDSNYPVMTVRQAIDEAIAAAPQQEVK